MKCEMCDNFDPARYIATIKAKNIQGGKKKFLCSPCARDLEKICMATDIINIETNDDWED